MNKHVQIRNLPEATHRKLKTRAASRGMTITDYVKDLVDQDLAFPSNAEIVERLRKLPQVDIGDTAAEMVRQDRDSR
jgi:antitoxin FitA